jgi:hypothetical protein
MKNQYLYRGIVLLVLIISISLSPKLFSQIKVGNNPASINANAMLDVESTNKGLLLPRLSLASTINPSPLSNFVAGMFVYNTVTAGDVTPGLYYSDGSQWIKVNGAANNNSGWGLMGNAGTSPGTDFLGTTDNKDLIFKTNSQERLRIKSNGWTGIGTSSPGASLHVKGQIIIDTLQSGNKDTDSLLVADATGRVKRISSLSYSSQVVSNLEIVANNGQTAFTTPGIITDANKIFLYRNGVLISFSIFNNNTILSEIAAVQGDEIKIIQLL